MYGLRSPLIPVVLSYSCGICIGMGSQPGSFPVTAVMLLCLLGVLYHLVRPLPYSYRQIPALFFLGAWVAFGMLNGDLRQFQQKERSEGTASLQEPCELKVLEYFGKGGNYLRYRAKAVVAERQILLRIRFNSMQGAPLPGDHLISKGHPERINEAKGPAAFNRQAFYEERRIRYELKLGGQNYTRIQEKVGWVKDPWTRALRLREKLFRKLREATPLQGKALAVASALWLGRKSDMPDALREDYADAGGMHVLAVSGLHVGIVYLMLLWMSYPLRRSRWGKRLRPFGILILLWGYALLTGWSASVVRAVLMFSLYTLGEHLERPPPLGNAIAGSALLVLLFDPSMIRDIGFLLSYAAVISIITLYPWIEGLFRPRWKFFRWLWSLLAVSAAAQLGVLPIVLFVFGKFPLWFGITNPLLLPLATLALYAGLFTGLSFLFPGGPEWVGGGADLLLQGMNAWVGWIASWPGSGYEIGPIPFYSSLMLGATTACFILWLHRKLSHLSLQGIISALLLLLLHQAHQVEESKALIQHWGRDPPVTALRKGEGVLLLSPDSLKGYRKRKLMEFWRSKGVERIRPLLFGKGGRSAALRTDAFSILYWNGPVRIPEKAVPREGLDLFLIGSNAPSPRQASDLLMDASHWISLKDAEEKVWEQAARKRGKELHDLPEEGAYIASL